MKRIHILLLFLFFAFNAVSNDERPLEVNNFSHLKYGINEEFLNKFSRISSFKTFKKEFKDVSIIKVNNTMLNTNYMVSEVMYSTPEGESTYTIVTNLSQQQQSEGKIVVDCTGSCDCREKLNGKPDGSYTVECTCSNCTMTIEKDS